MPLLSVGRFLTGLLSLLILAAAVYFMWSWYDGRLVQDAAGHVLSQREAWRLWTGVGLLTWSFLGRAILPFLLARPGGRPTRPDRCEGRMIDSPTGARLYVEFHGPAAGPPIIFTHGWGMDSTFWRYAREDLADRFRLVLWDLPGLGKSKPGGRGSVSLEAFAEDLSAVIEATGGRPPVLVGHSIGGMTIQTLIRDCPDVERRLAGIVLLDTTYTNPLRTMILSRLALALRRPVLEPAMRLVQALQPLVWIVQWQSYLSGSAYLAHRLGFGRFVTRSQLDHATLLSTRNPPGLLALGNLAMFRWDAAGALARLRVPLLVIAGDWDIVTKLDANRAIALESASGRLEVVSGANHLGPMECAEVYDRMIGEFALRAMPDAASDRRPAAQPDRSPAERRPPAPDARPPTH